MNDVTKDLLKAMRIVAQMAEDLKKPCGTNPESPQAIRNAQYMNISYAARAAIARAEAALAEPQPDADGWIPWIGDTRSGPKIQVEVQFRNGETDICDPKWLRWEHGSDDSGLLPEDDIIAYRVVEAQP